jgi:organic radical activating enzyme
MKIQDIFFSFQGEGPFIGYPQIFIRFFGCNISCDYCDENSKVKFQDLSVTDLLSALKPYYAQKPHSISLTGGEPLLQVDAIKELIPSLKLPLYLESNGTLPKHLTEIVNDITYFSIDYKTGFAENFFDFLALIQNKPNVFIKYVLVKNFDIMDLKRAIKIISSLNNKIPLILQPVSPIKKSIQAPTPEDLHRAYNLASSELTTVRIIGQMHKSIGIK